MNEIIKELYTIEERAGQITKNTQEQKQKVKEEQKRQEEMIQKELQAEMEGRLAILKSGLEEQAAQEIQEIVEKNEGLMEKLNQEYEGSYQEKAEKILKHITEG